MAALSANLRAVKRAASRRASADEGFRAAVLKAHADGESLRAIANAAGLSHVRVLQIVRGE